MRLGPVLGAASRARARQARRPGSAILSLEQTGTVWRKGNIARPPPRELQEIRGEHTASWREIDREMQETARRLPATLIVNVGWW